jgi:GT2 family glycosyltransferase
MKNNKTKITAIVLNWNNYTETSECVKSLKQLEFSGLDIVVVDNGSIDDSVEVLESRFTDINIISNSENLGFSGGMNVGIRYAQRMNSDYVWILNNDIKILDENLLNSLYDNIESITDCMMISPKINNETGETWFEQGTVDRSKGKSFHIKSRRDCKLVKTDYVPFCCTLVDLDLANEIGLLDEGFFLYLEDVDYCLRTMLSGYEIYTDLSRTAIHSVNSSTGPGLSPLPTYYQSRNKLRIIRLYCKKRAYLFYIWWVLKAIVDRIINGEFESIISLLTGVIHGIVNRKGKGPYP